MHKILALSAVAALFAGNALAQCSCFANTPPGTNLAMGDDTVRTVGLGFPFNFNGVTYSTISICTNGYVWLGNQTLGDFSPTDVELATGTPRIAPLWWDLNAGSTAVLPGGGVFYKSDATQANVVWKGIPEFGSTTVFADFELILMATGTIYFYYDTSNMVSALDTTVVGISRGGVANPVNSQVFLTNYTVPAVIGSATGTQQLAPGAFNLNNLNGPGLGSTMLFVPTDGPVNSSFNNFGIPNWGTCTPSANPVLATASTSVGTACSSPNGSIYQNFTVNTGLTPNDLANTSIEFVRSGASYTATPGPGLDPNYTTNGTTAAMTDDSLVTVPCGAMGTFSFGSQSFTQVIACSNGFVWLGTGTSTDFSPTSAELRTLAARLAPLWEDFNPAQAAGGTFYFENTNAGFVQLTWSLWKEISQAASANTFQVTLKSNGNIVYSYGALSGGISHVAVVGISGGGASVDPGTSDLVTGGVANVIGPISMTGGYTAMAHTTSLASLGQNFVMSTTCPTNNFGFGSWLVGFSNPNIPVDLLFGPGQSPGCNLYSDFAEELDLLFVFPAGAASFSKTIPVPFDNFLAGIVIFTQAAVFVPVNPLGAITSNGRTQTVGL